MRQPEMMSKAQRAVILDPGEEGMLLSLLQPQAHIKRSFPNHNVGKTHACLNHEATLLRINYDPTTFASHFDKPSECFPQLAWLSFKVSGNGVTPAGVPQIGSHEAMPAFRASPQGRFLRSSHQIIMPIRSGVWSERLLEGRPQNHRASVFRRREARR